MLVQALAKQDRDLQAIEAATEVGVDAVVPWAAQRSIADWPAKKQAKMVQRWENTLRAATLHLKRLTTLNRTYPTTAISPKTPALAEASGRMLNGVPTQWGLRG